MVRYALILALSLGLSPVAAQERTGALALESVETGFVTDTSRAGFSGSGQILAARGASLPVREYGAGVLSVRVASREGTFAAPDGNASSGPERETTVDAGVSYSLNLSERTALDFSILQEVTGAHDGQQVDVRVMQRLSLGPVPLGLFAGATWRSDALSSYLFGVQPGQARTDRPAYDLTATTTPYLGITTSVPLGDQMRVFGAFQADFFGGQIGDSPRVERDAAVSLGVGIQFSF